MSEDEAARRAEVVRKTTVLQLPGMENIEVAREQPYGAPRSGCSFDLYRAIGDGPAPTAVFVFGFPDVRFAQGLRQMAGYGAWGRLLAVSGLNAVAYSYVDPVADLAALIAHLRAEARTLGIDASRLGLWAASGNVPTAVHSLMSQPAGTFGAAALLYGYMLDVPPGAEAFGMAVPARGRPIDDLPRDVPLLVVRAGGDATPSLNASIDAFVASALARDLPLTLLNLPGAPHSFDLFDASRRSREAIKDTLRFFKERLSHQTS
jgi:hypothetical protein